MSAIDLRILLHAVRVGGDRHAPFALADWLEEYGDEAGRARADYIRLDERARLDPAMAGQIWAEDRLAELRLEYGPVWLGPLAALPGEWGFNRGLLTYRFSAAALLEQPAPSEEMARHAEWLEEIQPRGVSAAICSANAGHFAVSSARLAPR